MFSIHFIIGKGNDFRRIATRLSFFYAEVLFRHRRITPSYNGKFCSVILNLSLYNNKNHYSIRSNLHCYKPATNYLLCIQPWCLFFHSTVRSTYGNSSNSFDASKFLSKTISSKEINKKEYSLCNHKIKKRIIPAGRKLFKKITPLFRITTLLYSTERSNSFDFIRLFRRFSLSLQGFLLFSFLGGS